MEDKKVAYEAIASAKRWLSSAKRVAGDGNYDAAVYSLEMAVEIAMKAVLISLGIESPKVHNIRGAMQQAVMESRRIPKDFKDRVPEMFSTFNALLDLRAVGGYIFETRTGLGELEKRYAELEPDSADTVKRCERAVAAVSGKPTK